MTSSCMIFLSVCSLASLSSASLRVGFYKSSCPSAAAIVRRAVNKALSGYGCDASVVLKSTPGNIAERDHRANNPSLRGFEVIDDAKAQFEAICPHTVSYADIHAFAARDCSYKVGRINYAVPAGRREGHVSIANEVTQNLPPPFFNAQEIIDTFARKGISIDEMVTLSRANSVGVSHCSSFSDRFYNFSETHAQDPSMNHIYAAFLKPKCPSPSDHRNPTLPFDPTPSRLDNIFYLELRNRHGLLTSDQTLMSNPSIKNARHGATWAAKYAKAMVHMGSLDVLTGTHGEIRRQ